MNMEPVNMEPENGCKMIPDSLKKHGPQKTMAEMQNGILPRGSSDISLGRRINSGEPLTLPLSTLNRHMVCLGSNGSGKTVFCKTVCEEALKRGIPVIAVDPQGDLASMAELADPETAFSRGMDLDVLADMKEQIEPVIFTPASNAGIPICSNPFNMGSLGKPAESPIRHKRSLSLLAAVIVSNLKGIPKTKAAFFESALAKVITKAMASGRLSNLSQVGDLLFDLPEDLSKDMMKVLKPQQLDLLRQSFQVMLDSATRYLFDYGVPLDMDILLGRSHNPMGKTRLSIIYLNSLQSPQEKEYFMGLLFENIHQWMLRNPPAAPGAPQCLLFLDELGQYVPPSNQTKPICKDILITLFKQARKYGIICMGASQSPGDFDYRALGQTNTMAVGRLKTPQECKKVDKIIKGDFLERPEEVLPGLGVGEFYLWSPDNFEDPVHFQARLTMFGLNTLAEEELRPLVHDDIRERFSRFSQDPQAVSGLGGDDAPKARGGKNEELLDRISRLQERVAELETENAYLRNERLQDGESEYEKDHPEAPSRLADSILACLELAPEAPKTSRLIFYVNQYEAEQGHGFSPHQKIKNQLKEMAGKAAWA